MGCGRFAAAIYGQEKKKTARAAQILHFGDLKWTRSLRDATFATVAGDQAPKDAHSRAPSVRRRSQTRRIGTTDENATVLKGNFWSHGREFRRTKLQLNVGNFALMPEGDAPFWDVQGEPSWSPMRRPFKVNWVNPSEVQPPTLRLQRQQNRNLDHARNLRAEEGSTQTKWKEAKAARSAGWKRCARLFSALARNGRACRSVELRALCNEVPEPRQARKGATVPGSPRVPQITRSSSHRKVSSCRFLFLTVCLKSGVQE